MNVTVTIKNVDWELLREQKESLFQELLKMRPGKRRDSLDGIVHFLDHVQDQVAEVIGKDQVFGK